MHMPLSSFGTNTAMAMVVINPVTAPQVRNTVNVQPKPVPEGITG